MSFWKKMKVKNGKLTLVDSESSQKQEIIEQIYYSEPKTPEKSLNIKIGTIINNFYKPNKEISENIICPYCNSKIS